VINTSLHPEILLISPEYLDQLNKKVDEYEGDLRSRLIDIMVSFEGDKDIFDLASNSLNFIDTQNKMDVTDTNIAHAPQYRDQQKKLEAAIRAVLSEQSGNKKGDDTMIWVIIAIIVLFICVCWCSRKVLKV